MNRISENTSQSEVAPQRDVHGRFVKGNKGGPGNPFARQCAALRRAFHAVVTPEDIMAIAGMVLRKAKEGDLAAAKLLFTYVIGRPADAPNPDRLDIDEVSLLQEGYVKAELRSRLERLGCFPSANGTMGAGRESGSPAPDKVSRNTRAPSTNGAVGAPVGDVSHMRVVPTA
jgi:hypothetical protein